MMGEAALQPADQRVGLAARDRDRILAAVPAGLDFTPLMTAYLTDESDADDLAAGEGGPARDRERSEGARKHLPKATGSNETKDPDEEE